jgi:hypothetical protein
MANLGLTQAVIARKRRGMYPGYRGAAEILPEPGNPPFTERDSPPPPVPQSTDQEPLQLSRQFVDHSDGQTEPEPGFVRHPALAGFLAGLAGGEEGIRTLMAAKNAYFARKKREQQDMQEIGRRRDEMAERYGDPSLATSPEVAESIRQRQRQQAAAPIPEGYERHPFKPGELLRKPKPESAPKKERPASVAPGHRLVDPETGKVLYEAPPAPSKAAGRKPSDEARDRAFVEKSIERVNKLRNDSVDYNAQMRSISAMGPEKQGKIDPTTQMTFRELYKAIKTKNDAAVKEMDRLWAQVKHTEGSRGSSESPDDEEPEPSRAAAVGGEAPSAEAPDADIVRWLSSQDPDLGRELSKASPEQRAAWLARWRKANAGP